MIIRNIWGVGRNYRDHAKELNNPIPTSPLIFLKAGSSATINSSEIELPWWSEEVHHEIELVLKFSSHLQVIEAAVGLDLTERKLQSKAKAEGLPWTLAKSFHGACPVSAFFSVRKLTDLSALKLRLTVNDQVRQEGNISDMIFPLEELITYVKDKFPVCPGDLLLTGTPAGVAALRPGDKVKAEVVGEITHHWTVKKEVSPES